MMAARDSSFDVVIVGAGPAGSTCAAMLAKKGVRVLICEKAKFPREKICGDCVNPACWDVFRTLGVDNEIAANAELILNIAIADGSGKVLQIPVADSLALSPRRPFIAIKRSILDSLLVQRAVADGAVLRENTSVDSIEEDGGRWKVSLRLQDSGGVVPVKAGILIGADGRNSLVARLLAEKETKNQARAESSSERIGVQCTGRKRCHATSNLLMYFFEGGYGGMVSVGAGEVNIAMVVRRDLARLAVENPSVFLERTMYANPRAREIASDLQIVGKIRTAFPINPQKNSHRQTGAYLIGDARRTTEPFTGEGILFAMLDGLLAARKVLRKLGLPDGEVRVPSRNRIWRDKLLVRGLQNKGMIETVVSLGQRYGGLSQIASGMILR